MNNITLPLLFLALLLSNEGCSNTKMLRANVASIKTEIDSLKIIVRQLNANQLMLLRHTRADQQVRFEELERKVSALGGQLDDNQTKLAQIDEKTRVLKKGFEEKALADSTSSMAKQAEIESLFSIAMNDFNAGRRDVAISGFQDIVERFPESALADDASFWIGECYFADKNYSDAEKTYVAYIKQYAQGGKICSALYKLGLVFDHQKKKDSRNMVWEKLIAQCPNAEETPIAKARIKSK